MTEPWASGVLEEARTGFLAVVTEGATGAEPYVVPVSFAAVGNVIHFHGGEGRKSAALAARPRACLAVMTEPTFMKGEGPCADNWRYRSVLVTGPVRLLEDEQERVEALRAIVRKYDPGAAAAPFPPRDLARTLVYALEMETVTAKHHGD
jgi:nitroimidazol reductase NimA-like FMN-containing flavoprotein (pyridoxamine 5'-phosphate oxidase superfamily)